MRNILQYPVTNDEVIATLEQISGDIMSKGGIGDMRPYILRMLVDKCKADPKWLVDDQPA